MLPWAAGVPSSPAELPPSAGAGPEPRSVPGSGGEEQGIRGGPQTAGPGVLGKGSTGLTARPARGDSPRGSALRNRRDHTPLGPSGGPHSSLGRSGSSRAGHPLSPQRVPAPLTESLLGVSSPHTQPSRDPSPHTPPPGLPTPRPVGDPLTPHAAPQGVPSPHTPPPGGAPSLTPPLGGVPSPPVSPHSPAHEAAAPPAARTGSAAGTWREGRGGAGPGAYASTPSTQPIANPASPPRARNSAPSSRL